MRRALAAGFLIGWMVLLPGVGHAAAATRADLPARFQTTFAGQLGGRYEVRVRLERDGERLTGRYSYTRTSESLLGLDGTVDGGGSFTLDEYDAGKKTGLFKGELAEDTSKGVPLLSLTGTWSKPDGTGRLPFSILEEHLDVDGVIVRYTAATLQEADEKAGYEIEVDYPQLEGRHAGIDGFNRRVKGLAAEWTSAFKKGMAEMDAPPSGAGPATLTSGYEILGARRGFVSVSFSDTSYYPGTAHPSHSTHVVNYDLRAGKELVLGDLFRPGSNYLKRIADHCMAELADVTDGALPKEGNYALWNVTSDGLLITFGEYQVGPYVAGMPRVVVPYAVLARIARDDGPLAAFMK